MNRSAFVVVAACAALACSDSTSPTARRGLLYLIHDANDTLQRMHPDSLVITNVGALGVAYDFGDCAWNPATNTLYMTEGRPNNSLYTVNLTTGAATLVGVHGVVDLFALAYHPPSNSLVGVGGDRNLYGFNLSTGAATLIGPTGITNGGNGLVWDSARNALVLLTANFGGADLYTVNVATGQATPLAASPGIDNNGLTYDPVIDRYWSADYQGDLFQYDPTNSYARATLDSGLGPHTCIAYVP